MQTLAEMQALRAINWALYLIDTGKAKADLTVVDELRKAYEILDASLSKN